MTRPHTHPQGRNRGGAGGLQPPQMVQGRDIRMRSGWKKKEEKKIRKERKRVRKKERQTGRLTDRQTNRDISI